MNDRFSGISVFVEVARAGTFTLAAERLGLTKSAVSKAILRLEERLGDRLFTRSTRSLALTASGEAYYASCTAALDILRDTEDVLGGHGVRPRGRVRMDMPAAFGRQVMVPLLAGICIDNPDLQLTLTFTDRLIDPVEEGVDLVLRFGRSGDAAGLMTRTLIELPQVICASPAYLERSGTPTSLDDLEAHSCIVGSKRGAPRQWSISRDDAEIRFNPPASHQIGDGEAIIAMAEAGLGLCQVPSVLIRRQLERGDLVPVLDDLRGPSVPLQLVWPGSRQTSPRVRFLIDQLVERARTGQFG